MSAEAWERVVLVLLGWLLGLLAPVIIEKIKQTREVEKFLIAINSELNEALYRLSLANFYVAQRVGQVDRKYLIWLKNIIDNYQGINSSTNTKSLIDLSLSLSDADIENLHATQQKPFESIRLQKINVPVLDSRLPTIWQLSNSKRVYLLEIRVHLDMLNEAVELSRYYQDLTFGKVEGKNYDIVIQNLNGSYLQFSERARIIIEKIQEFKLSCAKI